uniref:Aspartic peptidase DDI1-type domain-containing protein n=1 Tax=Lactuca sativa TaxID=4236 RepID=A0A9R1VAU6_LACSA|nr:hypothetical protein LSAT_V11C600300620 [Lactuca sativa]
MGKREDDKFPSNTTVKPSHNQILGKEHQVIEIITLHSGKNVDNKQDIDKGKNDPKVGDHGLEVNITAYPSALEKPTFLPFGKRWPKMEDMWDLFSQVKINIPFVKLIKQVPSCENFLKDLCVQKCKPQAHLPKKIDLTEHVSSIVSNTLPPKLKDPKAPSISVNLGNVNIKKALFDCGTSITILSGNLFDQHDLGTMEQTDIIIQLADK